jgi:putative component of toxin-antitoxin plasmid stabilization module
VSFGEQHQRRQRARPPTLWRRTQGRVAEDVNAHRHDKVIYLLLCGGGKSTQKRDIERAKAILAALKE